MRARTLPLLLAALTATGVLASCTWDGGPRAVPITEVGEGDCFSADEELTVATLAESCTAPHLYEVIATEPAAESDAYPGDAALREQADAVCGTRFADLGGDSQSTFLPVHLSPSSASWGDGDRSIVCLVAAADGQELTAPFAR